MRQSPLHSLPRYRPRPVETRRVNFHALARNANFYDIRRPFHATRPPSFNRLPERMREIDLLCDEAEAIVRRLELYALDEFAPEEAPAPRPRSARARPDAIQFVEFSVNSDQTTCPICLGDFANPSRLSALPCGHLFHPDCIACWVCGHPTCPVCRHSLT
jgi:hypothetical protein